MLFNVKWIKYSVLILMFFTACQAKNSTDINSVEIQTKSSAIAEVDLSDTNDSNNEFTAEAVNISSDIEQNIKKSIQDFAADDDFILSYLNLFFTDLNDDGINEIIIFIPSLAYRYGSTAIYDVSGNGKFLGEFHGYHFDTKNLEYKDKNEKTHYISRVEYWASSDNYYIAYYDITYNNGEINIQVPFCGIPNTWYDKGEFNNSWYLYSNCAYEPTNNSDYPFITENAAFIGEYPIEAIDLNNGGKDDFEDIKLLIYEKVYSDMTFIKDVDEVAYSTAYDKPKDFEAYWEIVSDEIMQHY